MLRTSKYRSCVGVFYMYICMYMYIYSLHLAMCTCTSYVLHVQSCIHVRVMYMYVYIHQTHLMAYKFVSRTKVRTTVNEVFFFAAGDVPGAGTFTGDAVATVVATVVALFSTSVVDAGATLSEVALFLECGDPLTHFAIVSFSFVKSTTPLK